MALFIEGRTLCPLCGKPIEHVADATQFPAFLSPGHPLYKFSDAVFHTACFVAVPEHAEVEAVFSKYRELWDFGPNNLQTEGEKDNWGREAFNDF